MAAAWPGPAPLPRAGSLAAACDPTRNLPLPPAAVT